MRDAHYCPFCGEGWPEEKTEAWAAYDLLHELATGEGMFPDPLVKRAELALSKVNAAKSGPFSS